MDAVAGRVGPSHAQEGAWAQRTLIRLTGAPVQQAWMADVAESMAERLKWAHDRARVLVLLLIRDTPWAALRRVTPMLTITPPKFVERSLVLTHVLWRSGRPVTVEGIAGPGFATAGRKAWLTARREAYEPAAAEFGLPQPEGVLLVAPRHRQEPQRPRRGRALGLAARARGLWPPARQLRRGVGEEPAHRARAIVRHGPRGGLDRRGGERVGRLG